LACANIHGEIEKAFGIHSLSGSQKRVCFLQLFAFFSRRAPEVAESPLQISADRIAPYCWL
jgi:hypothetical protein